MRSTISFALAGVSSLFVKGVSYARSLVKDLGDCVDQNTAHYYIGYRGSDFDAPWAKYFNNSEIALSQEFVDGLERSPVSSELGTSFQDAGKALNEPGYLPLENGYTKLKDGTLLLAIRTDVPPNFSGEMFDFWFSWHMNDTTKYKLWHPGQHQYAALTEEDIVSIHNVKSYRERYWNRTSFVSEYVTDTPQKLSINFFDPRLLGFSLNHPPTKVETIVTAFVQTYRYIKEDPAKMAKRGFTPFDLVLAHQVRERPDGTGYEIRSRFWFGSLFVSAMSLVMNPYGLAHDLSTHCAAEMAHLGTFLPALFAELRDDLPTLRTAASPIVLEKEL